MCVGVVRSDAGVARDDGEMRRGLAGESIGPNATDRRQARSRDHDITEARGNSLVAQLTAANVNDITQLDARVAGLPGARGGTGRPWWKPTTLQA